MPPDRIASGSGVDPLYMVTNGVPGQLGIAGVGPGDGPFHGGAWAVWPVTFNAGVTPYLRTSDEAVMAPADAGDVTVVRARLTWTPAAPCCRRTGNFRSA